MMQDLFLIGTLPRWLITLIAVAVVVLLVQQYLALKKRLRPGQATVLTLFRAAVYAVLLFFLLGPALVDRKITKLRRPLTVLIDSSQSMAFPAASQINPGDKTKSRLQLVQEHLTGGEQPLIQRLNRDYDLQVIRFGTHLEPIAPSGVRDTQAQAPGTKLLELLQTTAQDAASHSGIVLFTDGITNGDRKALEVGSKLPVPVFTVGAADAEGFVDLRFAKVGAPEFAFRNREFAVELTVQAAGLKGKTVPVYFNRGKSLISRQNVAIDADVFEKKLSFSFTPKDLGTLSFSATLPNQAGEVITQNNHKEFKVEVQRDKIRVLTLSGAPAWNYRFLRMAIKQDPLIDLVSFVFLRTPSDSVDVPQTELSLIPFPIDDIFIEELKNFDVVFFDNFSHQAYFNPVYLERVRDFVRDGGGFAMFGGIRSFDSGGHGDSALKEVLPVELDGKGEFQPKASVKAVVTTSGKAHPVTRLLPGAKGNEEEWSKMPVLEGLNQVRGARGETLLRAGGTAAQPGAPLLTVGRFGKGRTLALMSDDAWRWNFAAVGSRQSPQNHLKLIRQAVRWLAQEPSFEQVRLDPLPTAQPGEKVVIKLKVFKDDFTPTREASVQLKVTGPDGDPSLIPMSAATEEGEYRGEFTPTKEGTYRVDADASLGGKPLGKDRNSFSATFAFGETDDGRPRPDLLQQIAQASGGAYFPIAQWNDQALATIAAKLENHAPSQIVERRQTRLWNTLAPFTLVLLLLSIEWWLRRKWGLI